MKNLLALIGFLAIVAAVAAAVFFFGGFYDVAATQADPPAVDWALAKVRQASVAKHAGVTGSVSLEDPAVVQAGARAFASRGCPTCHGAPGVEWQKFAEGLRPDPPGGSYCWDRLLCWRGAPALCRSATCCRARRRARPRRPRRMLAKARSRSASFCR